jgi:hypothetical protein
LAGTSRFCRNSFIFAAGGQALLRAFEARCPDLIAEMRAVVTASAGCLRARLAGLYERLPELDFSRDILQRSPSLLRVLSVPRCGWSDLGIPRRVGAAVAQGKVLHRVRVAVSPGAWGFVDLAARHLQMAAMAVRLHEIWLARTP